MTGRYTAGADEQPALGSDWKLSGDWREIASLKARGLFANQGLHDAAVFIAKLHPNAIDYLSQAPVLACTYGPRGTHSDKLYIASRIGGPIERGERLRNVMAAVGFPQPMKRIAAFALTPTSKAVLYQLARISPSALAFAIPEKPGQQRTWLSRLKTWNGAQSRRTQIASLPFEWAAREISRHLPAPQEVSGVADYLISNAGNERWSWDKAFAEMQLWHDRLASEKALLQLGGGIGAETVIDYSDLPATWEKEAIQFVKLDTPAKLFEEGRVMRHCVASYLRDVINGRCTIYSIRNADRRLATCEIQLATMTVVQLAGFANSTPKPFVRAAVSAFMQARAAIAKAGAA